MKELTIVRENLMNVEGYSGYCGAMENCSLGMPRTKWDKDKEQFVCQCGWVSQYPKTFIRRYKKRWSL